MNEIDGKSILLRVIGSRLYYDYLLIINITVMIKIMFKIEGTTPENELTKIDP